MTRCERLKKLAKIASVPFLGMLMSACGTVGPATVEGECRIFRPISSSVEDTAQTRREVVSHNAAGAAACGWRP